jgi:hypothetical protein
MPGAFSVGSGTRSAIEMVITPPAGGPSASHTSLDACTQTITRSCAAATRYTSISFASNGVPLPNGKWTLSLTGQSTRTVYTDFTPTATPSNVTATGTGASQMDVHWDYTGVEPDLTGFELSDGQGNTFTASKSDRSFTTYYNNPTPGTYAYHFTVTALRKSGNGGADLRSAASSPADAQLVTPQPPPPPPSPTPSPTGGTTGGTTTGGTTGSTTGGSTTGGSTTGGSTTGGSSTGGATGGTTGHKPSSTTGTAAKPIVVPTLPPLVASRRSFALNFNKFSPSLGIPKLPPLPATTFPATAGESGLGDVYQPTLPYKTEGKKTTNVLSSPIASIRTALDTEALVRGLAGCLILLAVAAHVRFFLSQPHEE